MVKVEKLNKYYFKGSKNELHVINNTSLELPNTGLISFLGHSGSGKTTLLNVLGGLDSASGVINYDDLKIKNYNMKEFDQYRLENIGYVFQNYNLLQDETVYDNLRLALEIFGITDPVEVDKRIEYALKAIGMYKYRKKKAYALSGGQQQRVSIARALVKKCKIIIADEPTGNLDSENTIEVMNILKKISKNSLVLLVTHDRNIASFYSDEIYEIKDGSIISHYLPNESEKLKVSFDNNIYLKDLNYKEDKSSLGNVKIYYDQDEEVDLSIIIKNGTVYIDSKSNIKLLKETNVNLKNEHYKDISKDEINFNFDNSWYSSGKKMGFFKELFNNLKDGFFKFKNAHKKMKFLYFALGLIGFLLATSFIIFTNSKTVDDSEFFYNKNFNTIVNEDFQAMEADVLEDVYELGYIDKIFEPQSVTASFVKQITYVQSINYSEELEIVPLYEGTVNLYSGEYPKDDNEIIVPYEYAVNMVAESLGTMTIDSVIGSSVDVLSGSYRSTFVITGISIDDHRYLYVKENRFLTYSFGRSDLKNSTTYRYAQKEIDEDGNSLYKVVYGRDLNNSTSGLHRLEVLANFDDVDDISLLKYNAASDSYGMVSYTYENTFGMKSEFEAYIVGYYKYERFDIENNQYICNAQLPTSWYDKKSKGICALENDEYLVIEGRDLESDDEIVVPYLSTVKIGDVLYDKTVVGYYTGSTLAMSYKCLGKANPVFIENYTNKILFTTNKLDLINQNLKDVGLFAIDIYAHQYNLKLAEEASSLIIFTILFLVLFITSIIFIYFIMRSKMISSIYSIGIYRAIGATRWTLIKRFIAETFILACFTCFIGYLIASLSIGFVITFLNNVFDVSILTFDWLFIVLGSGIMFILIVFFGVLPILSLLRKTPTMICAKYDI